MAVLENEKIERHIMKNVPGGYNLFVQDKEVATLIENLYSVRVNYIYPSQIVRYHCRLVRKIAIAKDADSLSIS